MLRMFCVFFFFQAEDGIRDHAQSRGLGDVYKRQKFHLPLSTYISQAQKTRVQQIKMLNVFFAASQSKINWLFRFKKKKKKNEEEIFSYSHSNVLLYVLVVLVIFVFSIPVVNELSFLFFFFFQ
eukprot:TRINITY_DN7709_c0_g2_i11.p3 TRINITY_DN7709_c0_g2~~TRINITY_DN7709_c0_g2_i11.p3  ORF type:complete len:124 (+),score=27.58 TRINITY_DN7709_c0_g2_i11:35-406(+)